MHSKLVSAAFERIRNSNLIRSFIATMMGSGLSKVILVAATFVCSNMMTKAEFGELSFVRNTLNTVLCICALNFAGLCTKFTTEARYSKAAMHRLAWLFLISFGLCVVAGAGLVLLPESVLLRVLQSEMVVRYFRIIGIFLPFFMLQPLIEGVLRGLKRFKLIGILQVISSFFFLAAIYAGIRINGLNGAMIGMMAYYMVYAIICAAAILAIRPMAGIRYRPAGIASEISVIPKMVLPVFMLSFIDAPIMWIAQLLLSRYGSMESVGSMTAVMQIRNLAILIPSYFSSTFVAFAGDMNARRDYATYFGLFDRLQRIFLLIGTAMFILFSLTSPWILALYGKDYVSDWPLIVIASIGIPIHLLTSLTKIDLILQEHQQKLLYIAAAWNLLWIVALYALLIAGIVPVYSFFISQLLGFFLQAVFIMVIYKKDRKRLLHETKS